MFVDYNSLEKDCKEPVMNGLMQDLGKNVTLKRKKNQVKQHSDDF